MHKMNPAEGIRAIVQDQARRHDFTRLKALQREISRFAGVEQPALEFAFDVVMRGGPAEGAKLEMIALPGRALCCDCMTTVDIVERLDPCLFWGGGKLIPYGGEEMWIKDMAVA